MTTIRCFHWGVKTTALAALLLLATGQVQSGDDPAAIPKSKIIDSRRRLDEEVGPLVAARAEQISAELATLDRAKLKDDDWAKDWAGEYYTGDGLIANLRVHIAPKSGVAYMSSGCLGLYEANYGEVVEAIPGGLKVKFAIDAEMEPLSSMSSTLYFVRWGDQKYLVPEHSMHMLLINYNAGGIAREQMWGIPIRAKPKEGHDRRRPNPGPPGRPELPAKFAAMIIDKPTRLRITSVKITNQSKSDAPGNREVSGDVELEGGRNRGLFVGTVIECDEGTRHGAVRLVDVHDTRSRGTFHVTLGDKSAPLFEAGSEVVLPGAKPETPAAK